MIEFRFKMIFEIINGSISDLELNSFSNIFINEPSLRKRNLEEQGIRYFNFKFFI